MKGIRRVVETLAGGSGPVGVSRTRLNSSGGASPTAEKSRGPQERGKDGKGEAGRKSAIKALGSRYKLIHGST